MEYAGETWGVKVARVREALVEAGHGGMVVSELDEINWLLNIRGEGSSHNEVRTSNNKHLQRLSPRDCITPRHLSLWPWSQLRRSISGSTWTR